MADRTYFFTGFPGFIATRIIRKLSADAPDAKFVLLVHPSQLKKAEDAIAELEVKQGIIRDRFRLVTGDITQKNLALDESVSGELIDAVNYVFHLAAIYDLAVPKDIAYQVNVVGTRNVNEWVEQLHQLQRYVYFSTAYVSGDRTGRIMESELVCGQRFKNHYESTKYEAEVLVQQLVPRVPVTIIRPGVVLGDSKTGETAKFDGPYFMMRFLDKFARLAIPYVGRGNAPVNLVPVDYIVAATCYLAHLEEAEGTVYHLTDPRPYPAREAFRKICEALLSKSPSYTLPSSLVYGTLSVPAFRRWFSVEKETLDYLHCEAEYDCSNAVRDLGRGGIVCPDFAEYIRVAALYYREHRHDEDKRILVR